MENIATQLAENAADLLASGYISAITADALADYWLEAQFAALDADEPGGANSWSPAECTALYEATKAGLQARGLH
jgi:hypothetical protein